MAIMLSIGLEALPYALIVSLWFPLMWIEHGHKQAKQLIGFSAGLGGTSFVLFFGLTLPSAGLAPT